MELLLGGCGVSLEGVNILGEAIIFVSTLNTDCLRTANFNKLSNSSNGLSS